MGGGRREVRGGEEEEHLSLQAAGLQWDRREKGWRGEERLWKMLRRGTGRSRGEYKRRKRRKDWKESRAQKIEVGGIEEGKGQKEMWRRGSASWIMAASLRRSCAEQ